MQQREEREERRGLSEEYRARLERLARSLSDDGDAAYPEEAAKDGLAIESCLALIDQYEAALAQQKDWATDISEERDQLQAERSEMVAALARADELADSISDAVLSGASWTGVLKAAIAYRSARATTQEGGDAG